MTNKIFRFTVSFAILSASFTASTANVRFYLAYGDPGFASKNGSSVGAEIPTSKPAKIPGKGQSFTVQICVQSTFGSPAAYTGGCIFLGYDTANADARGYSSASAAWAAGTAKALQPASEFSAKAIGLAGLIGRGRAPGMVAYMPIAKEAWSGAAGEGKSSRPIGLWQAYGFGLGNQLWLGSGIRVKLAEIKIINVNVGSDIFGDSTGENGLTLNSLANATSRGCFFGTTNRSEGNPGTNVKYSVTASP